ncbi:DUF6844 domain-containing protein [Campylobacter upsaliensis]|uniref:DUF6844 domain-containing protein n=1 Tax=Campylobacter upsaliensis TaxID=28080 RepID=UPI0022EB4A86|nr:hypothetical protein [Campylobacter upsaliensis]MEB2792344.1 hypothetical protein [Campylobacter upsaliensis]
MKKLLLIGSLALASWLYAQGSQSTNEEAVLIENKGENVKDQDVTKPKKSQNIDDLIGKAERELKRKFKANPANANQKINVYHATTSVDVSPDDPQYFDYLSTSYNEALLMLKAKVVLKKSGEFSVDEAYKYYEKTMPDNLRQKELKEKVDARIKEIESEETKDDGTAFLQIAGTIINEISSQAKTPEEKKKIEAEISENIFEKAYAQGTTKEAFDSISGLIPYETFIVTNENGEVELGVLAYVTDKSKQLARDLQQGNQSKKTSNQASCKSAEDLADSFDGEALLSKLGITYFYNENCRPALMAYGMGAFVKEDGMNSDYRRSNQEFARSQADAFISNFLNSDISVFQKDLKTKQKVTNAIIKASKEGDKTTYGASGKQKSAALIKEMAQEFKSSSQMRLEGLEDARVWSIDNEDTMVVGVIRYYSMDSIEATRAEFAEPSSSGGGSKIKQSTGVKRNSNIIVDDF